MDRKTRESLELDLILERIAEQALCSLGSSYVRCLKPLDNLAGLGERLTAVSEMTTLFEGNRDIPLGGVEDVHGVLNRARPVGSVLEPEDWFQLFRYLEVLEQLAGFVEENRGDSPVVCALLDRLECNSELLKLAGRVFDADGLIRDNASPELAKARADLRKAENSRTRLVNKLLSDLRGKNILQEEFSTVRNGRYVLPVRAGSRGRLRGIVQASSATGETLYIEPLEVVEASNEVELAREREAQAIYRIMAELTERLRPWLPDALRNLEILGQLDGTRAIALNGFHHGWKIPVIGESGPLRLHEAHHPLLHLTRREQSIPITVVLQRGDRVVVLTGPNAGGKTTAIKTIALNAILLQCGSPIPASPDCQLPLFTGFFADIGDQQDLGEGVSTFSGHVRRLREILEAADEECLVLLDELGTGTDPEEGGALAQSLLETLAGRAALTLATSHLALLKVWADETPEARNASFSLDPATHRPTFRLRLDVPGASEAIYIAENEGLQESVLARARSLVGQQKIAMSQLLQRIEERERSLGEAVREAQARARSLEQQESAAKRLSETLRAERRELRERSLRERDQTARDLRDRIEKLIAGLPSEEELQRRKQALLEARRDVVSEQSRVHAESEILDKTHRPKSAEPGSLRKGGRIYVLPLHGWGEIIDLSEDRKDARVVVGSMEMTVPVEELVESEPESPAKRGRKVEAEGDETDEGPESRRARKKRSKKLKSAVREAVAASDEASRIPSRRRWGSPSTQYSRRHVPMELDLHGCRVEDAVVAIERYLDQALLANHPYVRLIHGTGEGRLYRAVHEYLRESPVVKSFRFGNPDEGGGGATIVIL